MKDSRSAWLKAWDLTDVEWQRLEATLLGLLILLVLGAAIWRLAMTLLGLPAPSVAGQLLQLALPWVLMLSASLWVGEFCQPGSRLPRRSGSLWACLLYLSTSLICLLLAVAALRFVALDLQLGSVTPFGLPGWVLLWPVPLVLVTMALRFLRLCLRQLD